MVESNFLHSTTNQKHYPYLGSDMSFGKETSGSVAKCQLFSQAIESSFGFIFLLFLVKVAGAHVQGGTLDFK